jgi:exonuclease SbcC
MLDNGVSLMEQAKERNLAYEGMLKIRTSLINIEKEINRALAVVDSTENIGQSDDIVNRVEENIIKSVKLLKLKEKLTEYNGEIDKIQALLIKSADMDDSIAIVSSIGSKNEKLIKLEAIRSKYDEILGSIKEGNNYLRENKNEIEKYLSSYTKLLKESGKCPLCNSNIGEDKLADIIKHYEEVH